MVEALKWGLKRDEIAESVEGCWKLVEAEWQKRFSEGEEREALVVVVVVVERTERDRSFVHHLCIVSSSFCHTSKNCET